MNLDDCNGPQLEAVGHVEGPLLVLAGAGSGKTRVITYRIAHLIRLGVPPDKILALSFTNKAAREVADRVEDLVGSTRAEGLTVSTFHALGLRILKEDLYRLGFDKRFTLMLEGDQRGLLREVSRELGLERDAAEVQSFVGLWKNQGLSPDDVAASPGDARLRQLQAAYRSYQALLHAQNAVDFDDLLSLPLRLFREHPDCLQRWRAAFHFLLVDEYQDTNPVQFALLAALAGPKGNLCVVGDDDQAIYGWRGARVEQILEFEQHFPGAKVVLLEENYRSTQNILDAAHAVVSKVGARRGKELWTSRGRGAPLGWIEGEDADGEAEEVANAVLTERYRTKRPWSDFAVLYRTNAQSRPFEEALRAQDVPHRVVGGTRFFDRKEVREVLAYLKTLHNPRDEASLLRIANVPRRGLGPQTLLRLRENARTQGVTLRQAMAAGEGLGPQAKAGVRLLLSLLDTYATRFRAEGLTPEGLKDFVRESGLRAEVEATYDSPLAVRRRFELLDELAASVAGAPKIDGRVDLGHYIDRLCLDPPTDRESGEEDEVTLLTLHSAKGLEFPVVFLTGLEEGLLPHVRDAEAPTVDPDEERRLCYVGMTRAKEKLFLCQAKARKRRGPARLTLPSRFLADIPAALTEKGGTAAERTEEEERTLAKNFFETMRTRLER